jgi:hypothetical protein
MWRNWWTKIQKNINILPIESYQSFVPPVNSGHLQASQARRTQTFHYISLHEYEKHYLDFGNRYLHLTLLANSSLHGLYYAPMMRNGDEKIDEQMVGRTSWSGPLLFTYRHTYLQWFSSDIFMNYKQFMAHSFNFYLVLLSYVMEYLNISDSAFVTFIL